MLHRGFIPNDEASISISYIGVASTATSVHSITIKETVHRKIQFDFNVSESLPSTPVQLTAFAYQMEVSRGGNIR
jgi:hypothetical protein